MTGLKNSVVGMSKVMRFFETSLLFQNYSLIIFYLDSLLSDDLDLNEDMLQKMDVHWIRATFTTVIKRSIISVAKTNELLRKYKKSNLHHDLQFQVKQSWQAMFIGVAAGCQ